MLGEYMDFDETLGLARQDALELLMEASRWVEVASKGVQDSDGFMTDYTLYRNPTNDLFICVFGDKELYGPDIGAADVVFATLDKAEEWFDSYEGFETDGVVRDQEAKERTVRAMKAAGYEYDALGSYDGYQHFFCEYGADVAFDTFSEVAEWLEEVCFDDPSIEGRVEAILHPQGLDEKIGAARIAHEERNSAMDLSAESKWEPRQL